MAKEIQAPNPWPKDAFSIFLAGTIDQGNSEDWQKQVVEALADYDVVLINPRRDDWSSDWGTTLEDPRFAEQVAWEHDGLEHADFRVFTFLADSKSPVTMLELGEQADKDGIVCCPEEFYRSGNIEMTALLNKLPIVESVDELIQSVKVILDANGLKTAKTKVGASEAPAADITETPAFKSWFSGSQVVDAQGKPLIVYHGTQDRFTEFKPQKSHRQIMLSEYEVETSFHFFTADREFAESYGKRVMEVYLRIEHPLDMRTREGYKKAVRIFGASASDPDSLIREARVELEQAEALLADAKKRLQTAKAYTEYVHRDSAGEIIAVRTDPKPGYEQVYYTLEEARAQWEDCIKDAEQEKAEAEKALEDMRNVRFLGNDIWMLLDEPDSAKQLKAAGYDGIILDDENAYDKLSATAYAVPDANQIKSAAGNSGAFDRESPSITAAAPVAVTPKGLQLPAGTRLYRGVGEPKVDAPRVGSDGCLWFAESPTMARTYIPTSGGETWTTLGLLCDAPKERSGTAELQAQLGFAYPNVKHDERGYVTSHGFPEKYEQLVADIPWPKKEDYADTDSYYKDHHDRQAMAKKRFEDWVMGRLQEYGYEPEKVGSMPQYWRYKLKTTYVDGKDTLLPNKYQPGTLLVFEPTQTLNIYDMTEGGQKEGDLMDPDYRQYDKFDEMAKAGYDGVKINDFAQTEQQGNFGHEAIGIFRNAISKVHEVSRSTTTHPEDLYADLRKHGSAPKCTCGHPASMHSHPPDFGCDEEKNGCPCLGYTEVETSAKTSAKSSITPAGERTLRAAFDAMKDRQRAAKKAPGTHLASAKQSYISPKSAELSVTIDRSARNSATIMLDLGVPNFTVFSISIPLADDIPQGSLLLQATEALLDEMSAVLLGRKFDEEVIVGLYAGALSCFKKLGIKDASDEGMGVKDHHLQMFEGTFDLPVEFVDESQAKVVLAASQTVKRNPATHELRLTPFKPKQPSEASRIINMYQNQSLKTAPRAYYLVVYNNLGRPVGVLNLARNWESRLLKPLR